MKPLFRACMVAVGLASAVACDDDKDSTKSPVVANAPHEDDAGHSHDDAGPMRPSQATVLDLADVKLNPTNYEWFDFRPNVKKLILAGAAETQHVAILWYTTADGGVGLHYHAKTESVYVIEGTQTDAKGSYPTGTVYFNPPGSGHQITDSSGFFLLAYAAPPDFMSTDEIGEYTPVRIDTTKEHLTGDYVFEEKSKSVLVYTVPLEDAGGMRAALLQVTSQKPYEYTGNYLLVLDGSCEIDGATHGASMMVVAKAITPAKFGLATPKEASCLALGVSF